MLMPKSKAKPRRFTKNMLKQGEEKWSLPLDQVESRSQTIKFFSPSAINTTVPLADVHLRRGLKRLGQGMGRITDCWLGKFFGHRNLFAYQIPADTPANGGQWLIGIHNFPDSAVYALRLKSSTVPSSTSEYFEIAMDTDPFLVPIISLPTTARAVLVKARSWAWQWNTFWRIRRGDSGMVPMIRLFHMGQPESLPRVAVRAGWWGLSVCDMASGL